MPRNSLRNVVRPNAAPTVPRTPAQTLPSSAMPEMPQDVQDLLAERQVLEARMAELTGGPASGGGVDARRFPVTPLSQRRAEDGAWARSRDGRISERGGSAPSGANASQPGQGARDPLLPERTGQRALTDRVGRFSQALEPALRDLDRVSASPNDGDPLGALGSIPPTLPLRNLDTAIPKRLKDKSPELREKPLRGDPNLRDFAPPLPGPAEPMLRALKARDAPDLRKLDILRGGSGDLDTLRQTAFERMKARRDEQRREDRKRARRQDARAEQQREDRRNRKKGKYD